MNFASSVKSHLARPMRFTFPKKLGPADAGRVEGIETRRHKMFFMAGFFALLVLLHRGRAGW